MSDNKSREPSTQKSPLQYGVERELEVNSPTHAEELAAQPEDARRAQEVFRDAEAFARAVVDTVREPLVVLSADLRVKAANRSFYQTFRVSPKVTENILMYELGNRQWDIPRLRQLLEAILPGNAQFQDFEVAHDFHFIGHKTMLLNARKLEQEGKAPMILLAIEDVTERRRAAAERESLVRQIAEKEATIRAEKKAADERETIVESIADGVFVCDATGRITMVNKRGRELFGIGPGELRMLTDYMAALKLRFPDGTPVRVDELAISRALRGEVERGQEETGTHPKTKRRMDLFISAAPLREAGRIVAAVAVVSDISRLRELDRLKDEFIAVAAHELKTPVAIMKGYAEALLRRADQVTPPGRRMLEAIDRGADRITTIVQDLLDVSKLHAGRLPLTMEPIDLPALVTQWTDQVALTTTKHNVRLAKAEPVIVRGDRTRLEQVLANLLVNAVKYSPNGGDIEVAVTVGGNEAVVSVKDHGVGIPEQKQSRIFQRFYSAHTGTRFDFGGIGVGLYISKQIVMRHGGRMCFESVEGKGSTFYFSLPLHR